MTVAAWTVAALAMNFGFWLFDAIPVTRGSDPMVVVAALYGVSHLEALMLVWAWRLHVAAERIMRGVANRN